MERESLSTESSSRFQFSLHNSFQTGIPVAFSDSVHLRMIPSIGAGSKTLSHWHPVVTGLVGGTIINTFSCRWRIPITLTVLPSFTYLHQQAKCITEEEEEAYSSNCWVVAATRLFTFYPFKTVGCDAQSNYQNLDFLVCWSFLMFGRLKRYGFFLVISFWGFLSFWWTFEAKIIQGFYLSFSSWKH